MTSGNSLKKPPSFNDKRLYFWKQKVIIFLEGMGSGIWKIVKEIHFVPINDVNGVVVKYTTEYDWTKNEKDKVQHSSKAKMIIIVNLGLVEFLRVFHYDNVREIWGTL